MLQIKHSTKDLSGQIPRRLEPKKLQRQQNNKLTLHSRTSKEATEAFFYWFCLLLHLHLHLLPSRVASPDRQRHGRAAFTTFLGPQRRVKRAISCSAGFPRQVWRASLRRVTTFTRALPVTQRPRPLSGAALVHPDSVPSWQTAERVSLSFRQKEKCAIILCMYNDRSTKKEPPERVWEQKDGDIWFSSGSTQM